MKILKLIFISTLSIILLSMTSVFAWFSLNTQVDLSHIEGNILTSYFHCGDGSQENPFIITRPTHLYNLTMLYEKLDNFDTNDYYFEVGYDLDGDGNLEIYDYDDNGKYLGTTSSTLNMKPFTDFLPIGTVDHPFGGKFNGNNFVIDNLTVKGNSEFDIGVFGYLNDKAQLSNLYLNNLTIDVNSSASSSDASDNHTEHDDNLCYVGYIAGHVEDANCVKNIYLNNATISGVAGSDIKNDYGYFGHCANAKSIEEIVAKAKGENAGFGGSVDMKQLYTRIDAIESKTTRITVQDNIIKDYNGDTLISSSGTNVNIYRYYSEKEGSFIFYPYSTTSLTSDYNYLGGGIKETENIYKYTYTDTKSFYISTGTNYLTLDGQTLANSTKSNSISWILSRDPSNNQDTTISTKIDGTTYYLTVERTGLVRYTYNLVLSTTSQNWRFRTNGSGYSLQNRSYTNYYLRRDTLWTVGTTTQALTFEQTTTKIENRSLVSSNDNIDYSNDYVTYFPLVTESDSYEVARKNTGYIISGSEYRSSSFPVKSGDIRISKYSTSDINNSYSRGSLTNVYTINGSLNRVSVNTNNFVGYREAEDAFLEMISNGSIYGLHFMSGLISKDNIVTANYTLINGQEYSNYQLPADSIDFNLVEDGYIKFFAGTYFSGNNSFFSLHHIIRDENNEIADIFEIDEIYVNSKNKCIYKYANGQYSGELTSEYNLSFSTKQIKKQSNLTTNAVYYFEIPVNIGEYALGSVDGGTGAYLMYLDIGANGGIDENKLVDNFENVEFRSYPDITETSVFMLQYLEASSDDLQITVMYEDKKYYITIASSAQAKIKLALLASEYTIIVNNSTTYSKIGLYTFYVN